jgi:hypothetical protein
MSDVYGIYPLNEKQVLTGVDNFAQESHPVVEGKEDCYREKEQDYFQIHFNVNI